MKLKNVIFAVMICGLMFIINTNAQTQNSSDSNGTQTNKQTNDKPLKIIKKMFSGLRATDCTESSGVVSVRTTFDKSAKVTDAVIFKSSGCDSFDRNAVNMAKRIKFEPAIKDGEPTTITKVIQYSFTR